MKTTINNKDYTFEPKPTDTVLDIIHQNKDLTGTKLSCGSGNCGACTVLVDGVTMCSCLMPATHLDSKKVETIEAYAASKESLHPIQKAFLANDALQCGYCTPGFITEGIAFYDNWRKENGKKKPSKHEIAFALGGHLCRCGAYIGIYEAIAQACEGKFDEVGGDFEIPRYDALEKVTGQAKYTTDIFLDGHLEGKILRSIHAHAKILKIDDSKALKLDGVKATANLLHKKEFVNYVGQPIIAVAAKDIATANKALSLIKIEYEVLPFSVDTVDSKKQDAPNVWDGAKKDIPTAAEGAKFPYTWESKNVGFIKGSVFTSKQRVKANKLINNSLSQKYLAKHVFSNLKQVHTALEPHSAVAHWKQDDSLVLHISSQGILAVKEEIEKEFNLAPEKITVESHYVGGGFGGKQGLYREAIAAIELSKKIKKPVRIVNTRLEELSYSSHRPGYETDFALAVKKDGTPKAIKINALGNAGIAGGTMGATATSIMIPRDFPRDIKDGVVLTNTVPGTPFRGPDAPQVRWALEQGIDEAAYKLGLDAVQIRRRWYKDHQIRNRLLDWVESIPEWQNREKMHKENKGSRYKKGIGIASAQWLFFYNPNTEVKLVSSPRGIELYCSTQDIGNGTKSSIAQAVVDLMGIKQNLINVQIGVTNDQAGPTAGGSQVTSSVYPTTYKATEKLIDHLLSEASVKLNLENCSIGIGGVDHKGGFKSWEEILQVAAPFTCIEKRGVEKLPLGLKINVSGKPSGIQVGMRFGHGMVVILLEVDTLLGKIKPLKVWNAAAVGKIFVPELAKSQVYGGVIQGLGYALYEQKQYDKKTGETLTASLNQYAIPGIGDTPEIYVHFDEEGYNEVAGKGIGLAELCTVGVAASVGNAVFDATGFRPLSTPITPKSVLEGLHDLGEFSSDVVKKDQSLDSENFSTENSKESAA